MHTFSDLVPRFEQYFTTHLPFPTVPDTLYEPCRYFLSLGGKRVRPVLCLMGSELFGDIPEDAWPAAAGIELFHNFTLIHDDIMDKAPLRRGKQTVHERNGQTAGILCGDVMNIYAYDRLSRIRHSLPEILHLFNQTAIAVCEGQQLDMDFELQEHTGIAAYIHMITLKTSVLLACSLQTGAILGGATAADAELLYLFGKNLGIAFQLQDDYLDAFGEPGKTGKQRGGDILADKKTYLLLQTLALATASQATTVRAWLGRGGEDKIPEMLRLFQDTGARDACREAVASYSQEAFECLARLSVAPERTQALRELAVYLLQRDN